MVKCCEISVSGRVQNIGFRYAAKQTATKFLINGYARNELDGSVTIVAEGENDMLDLFVNWCRHGPPWARVDRMDISGHPVRNYTSFDIR
jgi:acylphosphatase